MSATATMSTSPDDESRWYSGEWPLAEIKPYPTRAPRSGLCMTVTLSRSVTAHRFVFVSHVQWLMLSRTLGPGSGVVNGTGAKTFVVASRPRDRTNREASTHRARSSKAPAKSRVAVPETVSGRVAGIWEAIVHAVQQRREYMVAQAAKFELTLPQAHLLRLLEYAPARTMASLADALSCDASNITGIVDRLEARGLIARGAAEHDRRIKTIVMTPA